MWICQKVEFSVSLEIEHFVGLQDCPQHRVAEICVCMCLATKARLCWLKASESVTHFVKHS